MKREFLAVATVILLLAFFVSPVIAIGPWQAQVIGNNPNLSPPVSGGLDNFRGEASGSMVWAYSQTNERWVLWKFRDPSDAQGLMNNAIAVKLPLSNLSKVVSVEFENTWFYLSGDTGLNATDHYSFNTGPFSVYGAHGMLWWFFFAGFGANSTSAAFANQVTNAYPNGALLMNNFIENPPAQ